MRTLSLISSLLLIVTYQAQAEHIKIASIDWPPQLMPNAEKPGYIREIITQVFKDSPYQLQIKTYPWSRAIHLVSNGKADALLAPAKIEAPGLLYPVLLYPVNEVGLQRMCFFTKADSTFQYTGVQSLAGMKIGILQDGSISESLTKYVATHPRQFSYMPYNKNYLQQSLGKLRMGRIDAFLFTYNSTIHALNQLNIKDRVQVAGCIKDRVQVAGCDYQAKVYIAFTRSKDTGVDIIKLQKYFDQKMATLITSEKLPQIMQSYGLKVWRDKSAEASKK